MNIDMCVYIYIYIYRERERERQESYDKPRQCVKTQR